MMPTDTDVDPCDCATSGRNVLPTVALLVSLAATVQCTDAVLADSTSDHKTHIDRHKCCTH